VDNETKQPLPYVRVFPEESIDEFGFFYDILFPYTDENGFYRFYAKPGYIGLDVTVDGYFPYFTVLHGVTVSTEHNIYLEKEANRNGSISGYVYNWDFEPVENAQVDVFDANRKDYWLDMDMTDALGQYNISVYGSQFKVEGVHALWGTNTSSITAGQGQHVNLDLYLGMPFKSNISGYILDNMSQPAANITVTLSNATNNVTLATYLTNTTGFYKFYVNTGGYFVKVIDQGNWLGNQSDVFELTKGMAIKRNLSLIRMEDAYSITGSVVFGLGGPESGVVANATVELYNASLDGSTIADENGTFGFTNVTSAKYYHLKVIPPAEFLGEEDKTTGYLVNLTDDIYLSFDRNIEVNLEYYDIMDHYLGIASIDPFNEQVAVGLDKIIIIKFNKPINETSFDSAFSIGPAGTGIDVEWTDNKTAVVNHDDLEYGTTYTITINTGLQSLLNFTMLENFTSTFTTEFEPGHVFEYRKDFGDFIVTVTAEFDSGEGIDITREDALSLVSNGTIGVFFDLYLWSTADLLYANISVQIMDSEMRGLIDAMDDPNNDLRLFYWNEILANWTEVALTGYNGTEYAIWGNVTHFTLFAAIDKSAFEIEPDGDEDDDGLPDDWEMDNFGDLDQNATTDFDGDGFTDLEEYIAGSNPTVFDFLDSDSDGLPDDWEMDFFGNLEQDGTGDYDGDGISDMDEYLAGSDPTLDETADDDVDDDDDDDDDILPFSGLFFLTCCGFIIIVVLVVVVIIIVLILKKKKRAPTGEDDYEPMFEEEETIEEEEEEETLEDEDEEEVEVDEDELDEEAEEYHEEEAMEDEEEVEGDEDEEEEVTDEEDDEEVIDEDDEEAVDDGDEEVEDDIETEEEEEETIEGEPVEDEEEEVIDADEEAVDLQNPEEILDETGE